MVMKKENRAGVGPQECLPDDGSDVAQSAFRETRLAIKGRATIGKVKSHVRRLQENAAYLIRVKLGVNINRVKSPGECIPGLSIFNNVRQTLDRKSTRLNSSH